MHKLAIIDNGNLTVKEYDHRPTLRDMQEIVGGLIEVAGNWDSHDGRTLSLYCDEEFLYTKEPVPNVYVAQTDTVLCGPVFFAAVNEEGETQGLTVAELLRITVGRQQLISFKYGRMVPIVEVTD